MIRETLLYANELGVLERCKYEDYGYLGCDTMLFNA
jgi:hypothetical protein